MIYILAFDLVAPVLLVLTFLAQSVRSGDLEMYLTVVGLGVAAAEMTRRIERIRRRLSAPHINLSSVWTVSAVVLLPPGLAALVGVALYGHFWLRMWRELPEMLPHRVTYNIANVIVCCLAAGWVAQLSAATPLTHPMSPWNLGWLALVMATYFVVNAATIAVAVGLVRGEWSPGVLFGSVNENILELATLTMGAMAAMLLSLEKWLIVLVFPPLYALHRSVLIQQFQDQARTDSKTGLLNAGTWNGEAAKELARAKRSAHAVGVLMIDIDHFRKLNNEHGHLVGDIALRRVAETLENVTRSYDVCGRFGGEEFVVLLPETGADEAWEVANRICAHIRNLDIDAGPEYDQPLRLSVSIGVACYPKDGETLDNLLLAADDALYDAKNGGRDQVRAA